MAMLHYTENGAGEPLILLHSGGMSGAEWAPQIPLFARHFRVIAPDHLGHGHSPMVAGRLRVSDMGRAVLEVMDELMLPVANLAGSSMGGAVALWLTVHHPERVSRLVLYRVGYRKDEVTHAGTRNMADPAYWRGVGMHKWLSDIHRPQGGPDAWEEVILRVSEALEPATSDHAHDLEALGRITQPALIVVGDRDPVAPLDQILEMFGAIPKCGLWIMPYATHVTATSTWRAEMFALEVTRFLQRRE
ncbi:MAG TPA: alpha/beta fold hydrolase [Candidatus Competibacteraceae bacterium]|nr:alpha/beta fold hydrolase [Candidatus Competibacteraceae bacterium]HRY17995.1 alpha/beta fold hydrolase [Candidatus Competibacteraceae bacterium]